MRACFSSNFSLSRTAATLASSRASEATSRDFLARTWRELGASTALRVSPDFQASRSAIIFLKSWLRECCSKTDLIEEEQEFFKQKRVNLENCCQGDLLSFRGFFRLDVFGGIFGQKKVFGFQPPTHRFLNDHDLKKKNRDNPFKRTRDYFLPFP